MNSKTETIISASFIKKSPTIFLQISTVIVAIAALAFLLWEPQMEGRNINATFFEIYFTDPFLAYAYFASAPFFIGLYQSYKFFGYVRKGHAISLESISTIRFIKHCSLAMIAFVVLGEVFLLFTESDDRAGGVSMGLLIAFASVVTLAFTSVFQNILQKATDLELINKRKLSAP